MKLLLLLSLASLAYYSEGHPNIQNKQCTFPFLYKGKKYNYCINNDSNNYWCALDAVYQDGKYANCLPSACVFPFKYKGKVYETCTNEGSKDYWCSIDKEYDNRYVQCEGFMGPYENEDATKEVAPATEEKVTVKIVCVDSQKKKHQVGEKWIDSCVAFECTKDGGKILEMRCQGKRGCHRVGSNGYDCEAQGKVYDNCSCRKKDDKVYNVVVVEKTEKKEKDEENNEDVEVTEEKPKPKPKGCRISDMVHLPGSHWTINCVTYRCTEEGEVIVAQSKCQGARGCFNLGQSGYPCMRNGKLYKICTCSGKGNNAQNLVDESSLYVEEEEVLCQSENGKKYLVGQRWTLECGQYACEKGGQVKLLSAKCVDRDGNCVDVGATQYKCIYKGKRYDECVCKGDARNPYSEGVTPEGAKDVKITQVKMCFDTQGKLATRWKDGCTEFACVNGESKVVRQKCRDDADKCFDLHDKDFPCTMDNKVWKKCSCDLTPEGPSLNAAMG